MKLTSTKSSDLLVSYAKHKQDCSAALRDGACKQRTCPFHKIPENAHEMEMAEIKRQSKRIEILLGKISNNLDKMKIDR